MNESYTLSPLVLAKDGFYANPAAVYRAAQRAEYYEPEGYTGFRSTARRHLVVDAPENQIDRSAVGP